MFLTYLIHVCYYPTDLTDFEREGNFGPDMAVLCQHVIFNWRLEQQLSTSNERNDFLSDELSSERKSNNQARKKLENISNKLEEASGQNNYLESLVLRYEQRVFELEELEVELKEKLMLLEECLKVAEWWAAMVLTAGEWTNLIFFRMVLVSLSTEKYLLLAGICLICSGSYERVWLWSNYFNWAIISILF